MALISLATVVALVVQADASLSHRIGLAVSSLCLFLGVLLALWRERVELRFEDDEYIHTRGIWQVARVQCGRLSEVVAVRAEVVEQTDSVGDTDVRCTVSIERLDQSIKLLVRCDDERAIDLANAISDRIGRPLQSDRLCLRRKPRGMLAARVMSAVMWIGMLAVAGIMLRPALTGARSPGRRGDARPVVTVFDTGLNLYRAGNYRESESAFVQAAKQFPNDAEIPNMLTYAMAEQGKLDDALRTALKALTMAPASGEIIDTVAEMHERRGEFTVAAETYRDALAHLNPYDSCETHTKLGRTLVALGRKAEAVKQLEEALRYPTPPWSRMAQTILARIQSDQRHSGTSESPHPSSL